MDQATQNFQIMQALQKLPKLLTHMRSVNCIRRFDITDNYTVDIELSDAPKVPIDYSKPPAGYYLDVLTAFAPFTVPMEKLPQLLSGPSEQTKKLESFMESVSHNGFRIPSSPMANSWDYLVYKYRLEFGDTFKTPFLPKMKGE